MDAQERIANAKRRTEIIEEFVGHLNPINTTVVSGGASGVDVTAAMCAKRRNIPVVVIRPDWDKHGRSAGFKRNTDIVLASDDLIAFWDMESRGTLDSLKKARKYERPFGIIGPDGLLVTDFNADMLKALRRKRPKMATKIKRRKR